MAKVLTIRLQLKDAGTVAGLDRASTAVDRLGRESDQTAASTRRLSSSTAAGAVSFRSLASVLGGVVGAGTLAIIAREAFGYNQQLESTRIGIAGLLNANREYLGTQDQWGAALAESAELLKKIKEESLATSATVPQLGDAFATTFGAVTAAGMKATNDEILQMSVRLTQAGNAFNVPMEQMRQEINSLITAQITPDSLIANRLGFDNKSVKEFEKNGTLMAEVSKRTESYMKAAEAQANLMLGKWRNTREAIGDTLAAAFVVPLAPKISAVLDSAFGWLKTNGPDVVARVHQMIAAVENVIGKVVAWGKANRDLIEDVAATALVVGAATGAFLLVSGAISLLMNPITWVIAGVVALGVAWHHASEWSEITVKGRPVAAYMRAAWAGVVAAVDGGPIGLQLRLIRAYFETAGQAVTVMTTSLKAMTATGHVLGTILGNLMHVLMAPFSALGTIAGNAVRSVVNAFGVMPRAMAPAASAVGSVVGTVRKIFGSLVGAVAGPVGAVVGVFSRVADTIYNAFVAPMRKVAEVMGRIPRIIIDGIPGARAAVDALAAVVNAIGEFSPAQNVGRAIGETITAARKGGADLATALNSKNGFDVTGPSELVKDAWGSATDYMKGLLPELKKLASDAASAVLPSIARSTGAKPGDPKAAAKLADLIGDYANMMNEYRNAAKELGDPLGTALAKIQSQREDVVEKLQELQVKLKQALGVKFNADEAKADLDVINQFFDQKAFDAALAATSNFNKRRVASDREAFEQETAFALEETRRQTEGRLALISDATEREVAARVAGIAEWFALEEERIKQSNLTYTDRDRMLKALGVERTAREKFAIEEVRRQQHEQLVGTQEWAKKMIREIGSVADQVTRLMGESKLALVGFFDEFFSDLVKGQADLGDSLKGLMEGLTASWTKLFSDMVAKTVLGGESMVSQLKAVWSSLNQAGADGDVLGAGLAGAGLGGAIGGLFQGPNNYAGVGGSIGGALGAVIGSFWGQGAIGAVIGAAIGTAVGSVIQKGKDSIKVAIQNGVASIVEEKGISASARQELLIQIQRNVKETSKSWQSIIDLLPQTAQDAIARMKWKPNISLSGGVENADITDEGALNALSDFLGNDLPKAAFASYKDGLQIGLEAMGAQRAKVQEIMKYWGTLQGKELQDAVRLYVTTVVDAIDIRDKLAAPYRIADPSGVVPGQTLDAGALADARRRAGMTSLGRMDEVRGQMATVVASSTKLTDIEDIVAAMGQVNGLARQYYEMGIARLQRIDAIEENIAATNQQIGEQIQLAGMDDQQKVDYYYSRMAGLRSQLEQTTNEEEIARISAQMQQYVQSVLGLAPDNKENRDKLMAILGDIGTVSSAQLEKARAEQAAKDKEALDLQQKQLEALIGIEEVLRGGKRRAVAPPGPVPVGGKPRVPPPVRTPIDPLDPTGRIRNDDVTPIDPLDPTGRIRNDDVTPIETMYKDLLRFTDDHATKTAAALSGELARALKGVVIRSDEAFIFDLGDLAGSVEERITRNLFLMLQANPDAISPR